MSATAGDFVAFMRQIIHEAVQSYISPSLDGLVKPDSWDPKTGTVSVLIGRTANLDLDSDTDLNGPGPDQGVLIINAVPLLTPHIGLQGAPIGMERVILEIFEGGFIAKLRHGADDSPNVPSGELHGYLRSMDPAMVAACYMRVAQLATELGHAQQVNLNAPVVSLGGTQPTEGNQIPRKSDNQTLANQIIAKVQDALNIAFAGVQPGSGVPAPTIDAVTAEASEVSYTI